MNDENVTMSIGPIVIQSANGLEAVFNGLTIYNLDGKEAGETVRDLLTAIAPFNQVTGAPLKE